MDTSRNKAPSHSLKSFEAITKYVMLASESLHFRDVVSTVLQAEHMPRARLYAYLESWGYQWDPRSGNWREKL